MCGYVRLSSLSRGDARSPAQERKTSLLCLIHYSHGAGLGLKRLRKTIDTENSMYVVRAQCKLCVCQENQATISPRCHAGIVHQATGDISDKWYGQQAVYRLSMGNFVSVRQLNLPCSRSIAMHLHDMHTMMRCADVLWPHVSCAGWSEIQE